MSNRFTDKTVVVIGAGSSGPGVSNGMAAAVSYAREGARVACVDLRAEAAATTVDLIAGEGGTALGFAADVTSAEQIKDALQAIENALGPVDALHNNVGAVQLGGAAELEPDAWDRAIRINLTSCFLSTRAVLPGMVERGHGAIVNISASAGLRYTGYPYPAYSAAKAGVNHLTAVTALEFADKGIRVNAVAPGLIETPLVIAQLSSQYASTEEMLEARHKLSPTGRMGTPWDVAQAALFLNSDQAAYINGVTLPVDGGMTIRAM